MRRVPVATRARSFFDKLPSIDETNLLDDGTWKGAQRMEDVWRRVLEAAIAELQVLNDNIASLPLMKDEEARRRIEVFRAELDAELDKWWAPRLAEWEEQVTEIGARITEAQQQLDAWGAEVGNRLAQLQVEPPPASGKNTFSLL